MNPYRVILIDPDNASLNFLAHEFQMAGFDIYKASSIKEGLILAYQNRPHVLIIDPVMEVNEIKDLISKFRKDWRLSKRR